MADTAAHLVDRVLPRVPVRQWVLSLPFGLRYRLAFDRELTAAVLRVFVRAVFSSLRRRTRPERAGSGPAPAVSGRALAVAPPPPPDGPLANGGAPSDSVRRHHDHTRRWSAHRWIDDAFWAPPRWARPG